MTSQKTTVQDLDQESHIGLKQIEKYEWAFEFPRITAEVEEQLQEGLDLLRLGKKAPAKKLIADIQKKYPECIEAHHYMAYLESATGHEDEAFMQLFSLCRKVIDALPPHFIFGRDKLPWGVLENRPFLKAFHGLGLKYMNGEDFTNAAAIFQDLLDLNPEDNQGVRCLAVECWLNNRRPQNVLALCDKFPGDVMEHLLFGKVLALVALEKMTEAKKAFKEASKAYPLIVKEILTAKPPAKNEEIGQMVSMGSKEQARQYWLEQGYLWDIVPGAREFIIENGK